jgi:adenine phosphoribosyltransferase
VKIAIFNMLGDTEVIQASAKALAKRLPQDAQVLITAEAKSIPLAHALAVESNLPYVVLRKSYKPYMGETISAETLSITTGQPQTLFLDEKDIGLVRGRKVVIVDDVISTGSTLQGMRLIIEKAGGTVTATASVFTEGERAKWKDIIALGHLPIFTSDK